MPIPAHNDGADASASAIVASTASGYHVLTVDQYSWMKLTTPNGQRVRSDSFRIGGHSWHIEIFPNGNCSWSAGFVSLFVLLDDDGRDDLAAAKFSLAVLDLAGEPVPRHTITGEMRGLTGAAVQWGSEFFVTAEELEQSDQYIKDDSFSVRCDITVVHGFRAGPRFIAVPPPDWQRHFRDLLSSEQGADVRFRVGGDIFAAHRCVLAARSPVLKAGLFGTMRESSTADCVVEIDGMRADVFKTLLHFIYTDSLPPPETMGQVEDEPAMAQHLLVAADRYGMDRLKLICEGKLCGHIDVSTAATTLALAEQHRCHGLKEACFEFLRPLATRQAVMATDGFGHLAKSCPSILPELMLKFAMWE